MSSADFFLGCLAVLLVGVSKAGFGGGAGMLATPILALVFTPRTALAVMLPLLILADWVSLWHYRRHIIWRHVFHLIPGALGGIALASTLLADFPEKWLLRIIGAVCLSFFFLLLAKNRLRPLPFLRDQPWVRGSFFGMIGGAVSTLAHAAGPIAAMYLIPLQLAPASYMGVNIASFTLINLAKLPFFLQQQIIRPDTLLLSLGFVPAMLAGTALGLWANHRLPAAGFNRCIRYLLGLTGLYLLFA